MCLKSRFGKKQYYLTGTERVKKIFVLQTWNLELELIKEKSNQFTVWLNKYLLHIINLVNSKEIMIEKMESGEPS